MMKRCEDGGVEDFVGQEHLGAGFGQGRGVEVKEAEEIGEDGQVRHESEEWDQPDDVPRVVRGEEEHQSGSEREGWRQEGGVGEGMGRGGVRFARREYPLRGKPRRWGTRICADRRRRFLLAASASTTT